MELRSFTREVGGKTLTIETGKLAGQAGGAVTVRYGDTVVLVTAGVGTQPVQGDFLPLTVDYEERLYAAGKIPGSFPRREGRPREEATLVSRLTDRTIRPLLPKSWRREIQVVVTVLSADQENDANILAIIGASAALTISEVPFDGPVNAISVGYINNQFVLNPTLPQLEESQLDLVVCSTGKAVVMVEAGARQVPEDIVFQAIKLGHETNQGLISLQEELRQACGKPKAEVPATGPSAEAVAAVSSKLGVNLSQVLVQASKSERQDYFTNLKKELAESLKESFSEQEVDAALEYKVKSTLRSDILEKNQRIDGRGLTDLRPIWCEVGLLPRTHGSALFNRGDTQVLSITTLGSIGERQKIDGLGLEETKRFMHHYNFPAFSTGEVRRIGVPGRREIGHGALAERALQPLIPDEKEFPYTIRLVSEVLSSSGSTSMASVCASSMSLMDAGIPVKKAVAGIAMGLITDDKGNYAVLTDIEGIEDAYGDMDCKIAGTTDGVTAIQMDIKLKGIGVEVLDKALKQAREARLHI
ncbi:MAG: polyribonucleotide nucleotidyltransferase, partial [Dehalococcoidia bacterium]|nr:polyribonucleotide nucleotidyltransferase [Dehalococcoidia bacterium]